MYVWFNKGKNLIECNDGRCFRWVKEPHEEYKVFAGKSHICTCWSEHSADRVVNAMRENVRKGVRRVAIREDVATNVYNLLRIF